MAGPLNITDNADINCFGIDCPTVGGDTYVIGIRNHHENLNISRNLVRSDSGERDRRVWAAAGLIVYP